MVVDTVLTAGPVQPLSVRATPNSETATNRIVSQRFRCRGEVRDASAQRSKRESLSNDAPGAPIFWSRASRIVMSCSKVNLENPHTRVLLGAVLEGVGLASRFLFLA